jgi:hypothetical protein
MIYFNYLSDPAQQSGSEQKVAGAGVRILQAPPRCYDVPLQNNCLHLHDPSIKNQTQRACNNSVENKGVEQPNSSAIMGACPVPVASATVLRSKRRRRLVCSPDSRGSERREKRKGISEGPRYFVAGEVHGSNHHDLHDLQSTSMEMTGGCTHPARGYAESRLGRHDVVSKEAEGVAPLQLGTATNADL